MVVCSSGTFATELASRRSLDTSRISIPYRRVIQPSLCFSVSLSASVSVCVFAWTSVGVQRHANGCEADVSRRSKADCCIIANVDDLF